MLPKRQKCRIVAAFCPSPAVRDSEPDSSLRSLPPRGISPEILELVELAGLWVEYVNHEVYVVEEHPPAAPNSLGVLRTHSLLSRQT